MSRRILAAQGRSVHEACADKVEAVNAAIALAKVKANALIHNDACHFEKYIHLRKLLRKAVRCIKQMVVDDIGDATMHTCRKAHLTRAEGQCFKKARTNMSEVFNAWVRRKNFFLNGMSPCSHRFWVYESIAFWNANLGDMPLKGIRRSTVNTRKRPAAKS